MLLLLQKKISGNILLLLISSSLLFYSFSTGVTNKTLKNGEGCICHDASSSQNVNVEIIGPEQVPINETVEFNIIITGGPAIRGGTNIAALSGNLTPSAALQKIGDELTHNLPVQFVNDSLIFSFDYTAPSTAGFDTIYANGNSVNFNGQSTGDQWNFAPNKIVQIINPVPVELESFTHEIINNNVLLRWVTASEINNYGFEIQRKYSETEWKTIGFKKGNGSSVEKNFYSFEDTDLYPAKYFYRIKQVDYNGTFTIYKLRQEIEINLPEKFSLEQNYPNPFNPVTSINFTIPTGSFVELKIYNSLGAEIEKLISGYRNAGNYSINFYANSFPSGIYYYELKTVNYKSIKKMILIK